MKQVFFALKNSPIGFKLVEHHTDPSKIVIKAKHPEVGGLVAHVAGCEVEASFQGSAYFLSVIDKETFLTNFGKVVTDVLSGNVMLLPPQADMAIGPSVPVFSSIADEELLDVSEEDDEEDDEGGY